jgi:hypothetical protein
MKISPGHYILAVALLIALTATIVACSPKSSPTPSTMVAREVAVKLVFTTQPVGAEAGSVFSTQPVVVVEDINSNVVTSHRGIVLLTITTDAGSSPPKLFGGTTATLEKGIVNFKELSIDKTGSYTLTAMSSGLAPAVSAPFKITPGAGAHLSFSRPIVGASAGSVFRTQPVVTFLDIYGNTATGSTAELSLSLISDPYNLNKGAILAGTKKAKIVNGVADFKDLSIDKVGIYALMAKIEGMTSVVSAPFEITPGAAAKLFFSTQPEGGAAGSPLTIDPPAIAVLVRDIYDNVATSSTDEVSLTITPNTGASGAVLSGAIKIKAVNGIASFEGLSINKAGAGYTLTASSNGLISAVSDPFEITPSPTPATPSSNVTKP